MDQGKLLRGKNVADALNEKSIAQIKFLKNKNITPSLTVIIVGEDPASSVYVRHKQKASEKLGIISHTIHLPQTTSENDLLVEIKRLNTDTSVHGILVQLPLPNNINEQNVIDTINPLKDVDCFHPQNVGLLSIGRPYVLPCTPAGIIEMMKYYQIESDGKHIVVAGRSNIVGKPMASLLIQKNRYANATVTIVHSHTKNMQEICKQADILIAAIGKPAFFSKDFIKEGAVVIDVGINRVDAPESKRGYKLVGDVNFNDVVDKVRYISPVPGGVGPMTIAMLMRNTITVTAAQSGSSLPE